MITGGKRWRRYEISAIASVYRWPRFRTTGYPDKAVGRYDQIVDAIEARFGGLTDALNARANAALTSRLPHELIQDIQRIRHAFRGFKSAA
jgi:hypothetical protein